MSETQNFNISLTRDEAENLHGTLVKHSTAVVMEKVQRQILDVLDGRKTENNDYYIARYGQPDLFHNNKE
ncbi:MAG: hypothetical protein Q4A35_00970 [Candidatus Gracilibacteria bacterium]|nr:hypothetical protein [Candidatus Gracilibacteria bacterium]